MRNPNRFNNEPIPGDMLDPLNRPGVQPGPHEVRYHNRFGKTMELEAAGRDAVKAQAEYISEWVIKILPPAESIRAIVGDDTFDTFAFVFANYDGDQFREYEPVAENDYLRIPLTGIALGVHGRMIECSLVRRAASAANKLIMQVAIVPGRPSLSFINRALDVPAIAPNTATTGIPHFATRFWINGLVAAGDTLVQLGPGGVALQTVTLLAGQSGPFPIHPDAIQIRYGSPAPKMIVVSFEVNS